MKAIALTLVAFVFLIALGWQGGIEYADRGFIQAWWTGSCAILSICIYGMLTGK